MTNRSNKSEKLKEILSYSWSTLKRLESGIEITGMTKDDSVVISDSEIKLVFELLKADNAKIRIGAIEILAEFEELSKSYIKEIIKDFQTYSVKEQIIILNALQRIAREDIFESLVQLINATLDYDILLEIAFIIGIYLTEKPIEGIDSLLKLSINKHIWGIITRNLRSAINRATQPDKFKNSIAVKFDEPPPIGISEEGERRRNMLSSIEANIDLAITKLVEMERQSKNKKERSEAKKIIEKVKKRIK